MEKQDKNLFSGVVTYATGSWYQVRMDDTGEVVECRIRGKVRLKGVRSTNPVVVGDRVDCQWVEHSKEAVIYNIQQRENYIIRRASNLSKESHIIASNLDQAFVVATLFAPTTSREFIDRFLVTCEAYSVKATILLNKADLAVEQPEAMEDFVITYRLAGDDVFPVSATEGIGIKRLRELLKDKRTLIAGNSGVGKSSLIQAVEPSLDLRTSEISEAHLKGKHTTTFSQMFALGFGGDVIDSPGVKGFGLIEIADRELYHYFPEIMAHSKGCRFNNCTHTHEPGCAVVEGVEAGEIAVSRYESYLKILEDNENEKYR